MPAMPTTALERARAPMRSSTPMRPSAFMFRSRQVLRQNHNAL